MAKSSPPVDFAGLQRRLQERLDDLPAGQQRIARLLLTDPEGCAFRTISQTAHLAQVHESSLVRFARTVGLSGYPALTALCRQKLRQSHQLVERLDSAADLGGGGELLAGLAAEHQANLARTLAQVDRATWDRAVTWLAEAPRVHVVGLRKCFAPAYLLAYLLRLSRSGVVQLGAGPGLLVEELRDLVPGEVLVGISIQRYSRDTVEAVRWASQRGVHVIALTDDAASPLARGAGACFYVACGAATLLRSMVGFVSLVEALATATAVRRGAESRAALAMDEELLQRLGVYHQGAAAVSGARPAGRTPTRGARPGGSRGRSGRATRSPRRK